MLELLESEFVDLPTPTPKSDTTPFLKNQLRLNMLRTAGLLQFRRPTPAKCRKILLIRPDHLGDLLFLTPSLRYLRSLLPEAHLTLMVGPWGKAVVEQNPHINDILICEFPGFTRQVKRSLWQPYQYLFQQAKLLKQYAFDAAIILRFDHWWGAWLAALAGIPYRFGYDIPEVRPFLTDVLSYGTHRHEVEQNWRLVHYAWSLGALTIIDEWSDPEVMGHLEFFVPKKDRVWAEHWLQRYNLDVDRPLIILHPGTAAVVKTWRVEAWAALAQRLIDEYECQIVFTGSSDEADLCSQVISQISPPPSSAAGQTSLSQLAALLSNATLAVGPDTGPMKLAAAVGTPTVELYGPVDVAKFGPWQDRTHQRYVSSGLSCIACNHLDYSPQELPSHFCVRGLSVAWVLQEVVDLLQQAQATK